jgi:hypothetical protein
MARGPLRVRTCPWSCIGGRSEMVVHDVLVHPLVKVRSSLSPYPKRTGCFRPAPAVRRPGLSHPRRVLFRRSSDCRRMTARDARLRGAAGWPTPLCCVFWSPARSGYRPGRAHPSGRSAVSGGDFGGRAWDARPLQTRIWRKRVGNIGEPGGT